MRLVKEDTDRSDYRFLLVQAYRAHVRAAVRGDDIPAAESSLAEAVRNLDTLVGEFPEVPAFQYELADTLCTEIRRDEEFGRRVHRAREICERLIGVHPEMPEFQYLAGCCLAEMGGILADSSEDDQAAVEYEKALTHLRASADRFPHVLLVQSTCAETLANLAEVRTRQVKPDAAVALLSEAIRRVEGFRDHSRTTRPVLAPLLSELRTQRAELPVR